MKKLAIAAVAVLAVAGAGAFVLGYYAKNVEKGIKARHQKNLDEDRARLNARKAARREARRARRQERRMRRMQEEWNRMG